MDEVKPACALCEWSKKFVVPLRGKLTDTFECQYYPPQCKDGFPRVRATDFCAQFEVKEPQDETLDRS